MTATITICDRCLNERDDTRLCPWCGRFICQECLSLEEIIENECAECRAARMQERRELNEQLN
jgi:hypothetical protein